MPVSKQSYGQYNYIKVNNTYELMGQFTSISESPNPEVTDVQYTVSKSKSSEISSYGTQWPFEGVRQKDKDGEELSSAKAVQWLERVGEEQLTGEDAQTKHCIVDLDRPIKTKEKTYYARECDVSAEITDLPNEAGSTRGISGNLNALTDIVIGEFNIETKTFTPATQVS